MFCSAATAVFKSVESARSDKPATFTLSLAIYSLPEKNEQFSCLAFLTFPGVCHCQCDVTRGRAVTQWEVEDVVKQADFLAWIEVSAKYNFMVSDAIG